MIGRKESGFKGRLDFAFLAATSGLVLFGTIAILSAAHPLPYYGQIVERHFLALAVGVVFFIFGLGLNYHVFEDQAKVIYGLALAMLAAVLVLGVTEHGHRSWFRMGFLSFQPAELARVFLILVLAALLDRRERKMEQFSSVILILALAAPVMLLILRQPDYSTTLTFVPVILGMLFCAGARLTHLFAVIGYGAVALAVPLAYTACRVFYPHAPASSLPHLMMQALWLGRATAVLVLAAAAFSAAAWRLAVFLRLRPRPAFFAAVFLVFAAGLFSGIAINRGMKAYQRDRFVAYLAPKSYAQGAAYHVHQSQIAIGSGGLFGKGLFAGTQSQLGFLPERHTDFIYAVIGEETGFFGTVLLLGLYLLMILRIIAAGRLSSDRYGYLVCSGLAVMFSFNLVLNVGMCVGLMPVAGIPLPLISYGGSSLVIALWSLGIVANIYSRRYSLF